MVARTSRVAARLSGRMVEKIAARMDMPTASYTKDADSVSGPLLVSGTSFIWRSRQVLKYFGEIARVEPLVSVGLGSEESTLEELAMI